jgi:hypothetical protein
VNAMVGSVNGGGTITSGMPASTGGN